ncbi:MAG: hypothetical protein H6Q52_2332 [Deltaproteobacteria bacterium]|nr:hypothetical protein [Deltaproteobacteria bacterium]
MLMRYSPGRYDEKIPFPVQKKIISYEHEKEDEGWLVFEIMGGGNFKVRLDDCKPLMSGQNRIRSGLKLGGLIILIIALCAGIYTATLRIFHEGYAGLGITGVFQFLVTLFLTSYLACVLKVTIERYLYGGLIIDQGEIHFQSDDEKSFFVASQKNIERRKQ